MSQLCGANGEAPATIRAPSGKRVRAPLPVHSPNRLKKVGRGRKRKEKCGLLHGMA